MDYKEKYNHALRKLQEALAPTEDGCKISGLTRDCLENIFPELKKNDDTQIKKDIIAFLYSKNGYMTPDEDWDFHNKWLAWLENRGEQKFNDNVKPKFKVGNWIVFNGLTLYIYEIVDGYYKTVDNGYDIHCSYDWDIDNIARLWTIQDAKDGDTLVMYDIQDNIEWLFLYRPNPHKLHIYDPRFYCHYDLKSNTFNKDTDYVSVAVGTKFHPATKEQRDLLFQKMKEAGYEWDAERKELKKIEPKKLGSDDDSLYRTAMIKQFKQLQKDYGL